MKIHNLINRRITKFCKRTMALILAALFVVPSIMYSMSNGFSSVKAASSYETVGVGKTLVECFPGEDRDLAKYVYEDVLFKSDWDEDYQLTEDDVSAIETYEFFDFDTRTSSESVDFSGIANLSGLTHFTLFDDGEISVKGLDDLASLTKLKTINLWVANGIITIPENLPAGLTKLTISSTQLTSLPQLPEKLTELNVYGTQLTSLPKLPDSLTKLSVYGNQLESLPALPAGLTELNVYENQLESLPELPDSLTKLDAHENQLEFLPELPAGLTDLSISNNQLTSLPELPAGLTDLSISNNQLTSLPNNLPSGLTFLDLSYNELTFLPDSLPSGLIELYLAINQLKEVDLSNLESLETVSVFDQKPQFEYIVTEDGKYKILDVPTKNLSNIMINGEPYNDYDNSGSITVDTLPTSFTYNYNTGYNDTTMNVTATLVELTSISIKNAPTRTLYATDEKFDPTGLVITLNYGDGSTKDVAYDESTKDSFTFSPGLEATLETDMNKVTITYDGKTTEQEISVKNFVDNTTLTDEGNGVTISGSLEENASLTVSEIDTSHDNYSSLLESLGDGKKVLLAVDVSIVNGTFKPGDNLILTFEVDPIYNGRNATVKHLLSSGQIETYPATVIDGKIQIIVTELSPFMIAIDEDPVTDENNADFYATGDNAPILALFAIIASSIMVISGYIMINRKKFLQK